VLTHELGPHMTWQQHVASYLVARPAVLSQRLEVVLDDMGECVCGEGRGGKAGRRGGGGQSGHGRTRKGRRDSCAKHVCVVCMFCCHMYGVVLSTTCRCRTHLLCMQVSRCNSFLCPATAPSCMAPATLLCTFCTCLPHLAPVLRVCCQARTRTR
jgi:hypothetical protein